MDIVLIGAPGAGKGTQSAKIEEKFKLRHISTGEVLRAEIASGSDLGKQIAAVIDKGDLLSDELMIAMLKKMVAQTQEGIIFDGFPRTTTQASALEEMLKKFGRRIAKVIMITLPEDKIIQRITSRKQCKSCGKVFQVRDAADEKQCKSCGGEIYTRPDDTPERAKHRIEVYHKETVPVIAFYKQAGLYEEVNGDQSPEKVFEDISVLLDGKNLRDIHDRN